MPNREEFTCIDLFAGAGGLSDGFRRRGFSVVAANDADEVSGQTFIQSHADSLFLPGPIQDLSPGDFLKAGSLKPGQLDCLVGGPPCQAFSVYNHQRGMHDARSGLFREYLRIIEGIRPKIIVMENVTGITSVGNGRAVREIHERLAAIGYRVQQNILKAEDFGVPQERRRIFFIATRLPTIPILFPQPTHGQPDLFRPDRKQLVSVWDAISDLPELQLTEGDDIQEYPGAPLSDYQRILRAGSKAIHNHVAPWLADINRERMKHIPQGGSWRDIPHNLLPKGMKRAKRSDHTKRYGRLHPQGLACTILTKCDLHWGAYIHPTQDRTITVREAARLQSFADTIVFAGSRGDQYRQVGNAVPPLLAAAVAGSIREMLLLAQNTRPRISNKKRLQNAASTR